MGDLDHTPLYELHLELGARMVPFAGYEMPVQYPLGVMKEHQFCREQAGLFDVSHMGQVIVRGAGAAAALETLMPQNIVDLPEGRQRYGFFTTPTGGILDDLMIANRGDHLFLVVNAANKAADLAHLRAHLDQAAIEITEITDRALLALQGPASETALRAIVPGLPEMRFMDSVMCDSDFGALWVSRSGYTGEDGFEISLPAEAAVGCAKALLDNPLVTAVGLGARDSLRLEAGLCLHGNDITPGTTPVEGALIWAMQKTRRAGGARAGGFIGADVILPQIDQGTARIRVGLRPDGRAPMRAGTEIFATPEGGDPIGVVTSGAFGPTLGAPMSMGYVSRDHSAIGTPLYGAVRGKRMPLQIVDLPFVPHTFKR